jgi:hypothetical protein
MTHTQPATPHDPQGEEAAKTLIPLSKAVELTGFSRQHMALLLRTSKVWGIKIGRNWLTTEAAIQAYLATEPRPGPKTDE